MRFVHHVLNWRKNMKAKDLIGKPPKILLYGPAGTGKTALSAQASGGYMIDCDNGMRTALLLQDEFTKYRHEIEFDTFEETDSMRPRAWLAVKKKIMDINRDCRTGKFTFDAVILDSLTRMASYAQNQIMAQAGKPLEAPTLPQYNLIVGEVRNMLHILTTLPVLVLVCTHERAMDLNDGGIFIKPKVIGKQLVNEVTCMFDEVWYTRSKRLPPSKGYADFIVDWIPSASHESRTRSGRMLEFSAKELGLRGVLKEAGFTYAHEV